MNRYLPFQNKTEGGGAMFGTALSGVLTFGIITTFAAAILLLTDQNETAFREFTVMGLFCSALIMISYYTELNAPGVAAKISAVKFGYLGRVFITPMLLMLVLRHYRAKVATNVHDSPLFRNRRFCYSFPFSSPSQPTTPTPPLLHPFFWSFFLPPHTIVDCL